MKRALYLLIPVSFLSLTAGAWAQDVCVAGDIIISKAAIASSNKETNDRTKLYADYLEAENVATPQNRAKMAAQLPFVQQNIYNPELGTGFKFPSVPESVAVEVRKVCPPGAKIVIPELRYTNLVAAKLCDLSRAVIPFGESVICVIAPEGGTP